VRVVFVSNKICDVTHDNLQDEKTFKRIVACHHGGSNVQRSSYFEATTYIDSTKMVLGGKEIDEGTC
jgi:hypothetical protein